MALTADRMTAERKGSRVNLGVAATTVIYQGALVARNSTGYLVPASADNTLRVLGVALENVDNSAGANGAKTCTVGISIYRWGNSGGGDEITAAHIGNLCYAVDDETVALTSNGGARPIGGRVFAVDTEGVWVDHDWAEQAAVLSAGQVTPADLASGYRTVASDGALALAATDRTVHLLASASGSKAATMTATQAGHRISVKLEAASGGDYTLAASGETVTLDAAGEGVELVYDGSAWQWVALTGGATAA